MDAVGVGNGVQPLVKELGRSVSNLTVSLHLTKPQTTITARERNGKEEKKNKDVLLRYEQQRILNRKNTYNRQNNSNKHVEHQVLHNILIDGESVLHVVTKSLFLSFSFSLSLSLSLPLSISLSLSLSC